MVPEPERYGNLRKILQDLRDGNIDVETAERELDLFSIDHISGIAAIDPCRRNRCGVPEVVYADTKKPSDAASIALRLVEKNGFAFMTRAGKEHYSAVCEGISKFMDQKERGLSTTINEMEVVWNEKARTIIVKEVGYQFPIVQKGGGPEKGDSGGPEKAGTVKWDSEKEDSEERDSGKVGKIGILTAGTSDIPVAEEAVETCRIMGCETITFYDVGIAGMHRLFEPLKKMVEADVSVVIVVAGMEGALPSVVSSLVSVPVIGVPRSVGYGYGGKGEAALMSMLQSCAPGLLVVNIDNGFGAGVGAALIAKTRSRSRR